MQEVKQVHRSYEVRVPCVLEIGKEICMAVGLWAQRGW